MCGHGDYGEANTVLTEKEWPTKEPPRHANTLRQDYIYLSARCYHWLKHDQSVQRPVGYLIYNAARNVRSNETRILLRPLNVNS